MTLTLVSCVNPVWSTVDHAGVLCEVVFKEIEGTLPFHAMPTDPEAHGRDLWARLLAGEFGPIAAYMPPAPRVLKEGKGPRVLA